MSILGHFVTKYGRAENWHTFCLHWQVPEMIQQKKIFALVTKQARPSQYVGRGTLVLDNLFPLRAPGNGARPPRPNYAKKALLGEHSRLALSNSRFGWVGLPI